MHLLKRHFNLIYLYRNRRNKFVGRGELIGKKTDFRLKYILRIEEQVL